MGPPDVDVGDDILSEEAGEDSPANVMTAFTAASAGWDEKSIFYQNELCQKKKKPVWQDCCMKLCFVFLLLTSPIILRM